MTSPDRARAVAELDALTADLPARADQLAARLARVTATRIVNGRAYIDGTPVCPTCLTAACAGCAPVHQPPTTVIVNGGVCSLQGPTDEALCAWCMEPAGTCTLTGGITRCEFLHEFYADQLALAAAPVIYPAFRVGGA